MRTTITLDDALIDRASALTGIREKSELWTRDKRLVAAGRDVGVQLWGER